MKKRVKGRTLKKRIRNQVVDIIYKKSTREAKRYLYDKTPLEENECDTIWESLMKEYVRGVEYQALLR